MPAFAYRILPPRGAFVATITEAERGTMGAHFAYLQDLERAGRIVFVGRCLNGDYGIAVIEAGDEDEARGIAEADPAVASGLMDVEVRAFQVVMERGTGAPA